jgi:Holliday junction resolvase-like predicted endonuclease
MKVDFFKADCKKITNEKKFGLYDSENSTPAEIKLHDEPSWNATVLNSEEKEIQFTAIDHCIEILKDNGDMDSRCDVMLSCESTLLFVELKNKRDSWQAEGLAQIEATIKRLKAENEVFYLGFEKRRAVVANAKHQFPCFQATNLEQREYFMKKYKARIQFEAEIVIS